MPFGQRVGTETCLDHESGITWAAVHLNNGLRWGPAQALRKREEFGNSFGLALWKKEGGTWDRHEAVPPTYAGSSKAEGIRRDRTLSSNIDNGGVTYGAQDSVPACGKRTTCCPIAKNRS